MYLILHNGIMALLLDPYCRIDLGIHSSKLGSCVGRFFFYPNHSFTPSLSLFERAQALGQLFKPIDLCVCHGLHLSS